MFLQNSIGVTKQLIRTGRLEMHYNASNFRKKYELGFWDVYQDVHNGSQNVISGPYRVFRPIYRTGTPSKLSTKFAKLTAKSSLY
jgi:hypothetical protein